MKHKDWLRNELIFKMEEEKRIFLFCFFGEPSQWVVTPKVVWTSKTQTWTPSKYLVWTVLEETPMPFAESIMCGKCIPSMCATFKKVVWMQLFSPYTAIIQVQRQSDIISPKQMLIWSVWWCSENHQKFLCPGSAQQLLPPFKVWKILARFLFR